MKAGMLLVYASYTLPTGRDRLPFEFPGSGILALQLGKLAKLPFSIHRSAILSREDADTKSKLSLDSLRG